jgi:RNA polymerase sigma-70 factor (ECF subfamily)
MHARALVISAEGYLGSRAAAEDAVSDVFANLWRVRATWAPHRSIKAYLFGAVRNAALAQLRRAGVETRGELVLGDDEVPAMGQPPMAADVSLDLEARMAAVERVLAGFPEVRRQIMYMRWQQGMSAEEIAVVLRVTRNAVDLQLSRAIRALRVLLPDWVGE